MRPEAVEAMASVSTVSIPMDELEARAGEIIAEVTGAESGYVTCGASAGLMLSAAACIARNDVATMNRLPDTEGLAHEIIVQRRHRTDYDRALQTAGGEFVEIGYFAEAMEWELEAAVSDRTAAALFVANRPSAYLDLREFAAIARAHGVPVIVDAAGALPPKENLRRFIAEGADLVVFSGGKGIRGPQASGFVAGRSELIASMALQHQDMDIRESTWRKMGGGKDVRGRPYHGIGRPLKVGKEEICGLMVALRLYAQEDQAATSRRWFEVLEVIESLIAVEPAIDHEVLPSWEAVLVPCSRSGWAPTKRSPPVMWWLSLPPGNRG